MNPQHTPKLRRPFLKWTGGKRWLAPYIVECLPLPHGRYHEPFLGGGSVFFAFKPWPATLSDVNEELINTYKQVRDQPDLVIKHIGRMHINKSEYQRVRASRPDSPLKRAVRFLYLNRTAFNGIYRVNQRGEFNVPFGCKPGTVLCDAELLSSASHSLQNRKLVVADFESTIDRADAGDVIYADPPYTTRHNNNGFRRYNESLFSWSDQKRLARACRRAANRGCYVFVSNAAHDDVSRLYVGFDSVSLTRYTGVSGSSAGRGEVQEKLYCFPKIRRGEVNRDG